MSFWLNAMVDATRQQLATRIHEAMLEIEALEDHWIYEPPADAPLYGRAPGEVAVRLWSVPASTGAYLRWLALDRSCQRIVEIGTSAGYSTLWMADALSRKSGGRLDTWEILPSKADLARKFIARAGVDDVVRIWNEDAVNFASRCRELPPDLIFLDADKEHYSAYLDIAALVLRPGGLLVVDNAVDFGGLMVEFHERLRTSRDWDSVLIEMDNGVLVARRL